MMRTKDPTFWLLDGRNRWNPAGSDVISTRQGESAPVDQDTTRDSQRGIRLAADLAGPLSLRANSDSLGGLVLPRGMALSAEGTLFLLVRTGPVRRGNQRRWSYQIKRFDRATRRFESIPYVGGLGREPRQFRTTRNIAIAGRNLYVADTGNRRVQVFDLDSFALRYVWSRPRWRVDVAAQGLSAYILDRRSGRVYRHCAGRDALELVVDQPSAKRRWSRIAVDRQGHIYLLNRESTLDVFDQHGQRITTVRDAGNLRSRFDVPSIQPDHEGRFCIPDSLARPCASGITDGPALETPLAFCSAPAPRAPRAWWFTPEDLLNAGSLAQALKQPRDPLSRWLRGSVSNQTRQLIDQHRSRAASQELHQTLRDDLNRLIQRDDLYTAKRFAHVQLPQEIRTLLDQQPQGQERIRLNRRLLEAAFPLALASSQELPFERLIFDRQGEPATVAEFESAGPKLYQTQGTWFSAALDSQIYRCQWHRIELELLDLPPGSQVTVSTYTDAQSNQNVAAIRPEFWETCYTIQGPGQADDPHSKPALHHEFLVQSRAGQYLWLRIQLAGDGYATPAVGAIRVHYPRESYLNYLPAVYSVDDESRWFLERLLSVFQTEWDALEQAIDEVARYFDPKSVPQGAALAYLAGWLALPLEGEWNADQQRRLLRKAPELYPQRGTLAGLRAFVRVYLENMHADVQQHNTATGFPVIVEGFRERQRLLLSAQSNAVLGQTAPLWGPALVGRLQLDVFDREGDVRLVSLGEPTLDLFAEYAHRFRVFVPAAWVRTSADERMLRRAIEAEKPAHTQYELCLVEGRYRIGVQSTVGIDTIIGAYPRTRLACVDDPEAPPTRVPRGVLGSDTVLSGADAATSVLTLQPGIRVGIDTQLT
ncbi:MAG TPA: phage tail protein [Herpetosiphonaceae bacterium]